MVNVILSHEVNDYTTWRAGFDSDEPNRVALGVEILGVYSDINNPNLITVLSIAPNAEVIHGMMSNPGFQERMSNLGVLGKPDMKFLNKM